MLKSETIKIKTKALNNINKRDLRTVVEDFISPKAKHIGKEYISNNFSKL